MSSPLINPLSSPLAQLGSFQPLFEGDPSGGDNLLPVDSSGGSPAPGTIDTSIPGMPGSGAVGSVMSGLISGQSISQTISTSILQYIFTSRFVLFIIGLICIIAGLYLLKPGPITTIITAPIKLAKKGVEAGATAATVA